MEIKKKVHKFTNEDLKVMQSWDLNRKILVSQKKIIEFYSKFPDKIYVSFSGGKDSTVLLHMVRKIYPDTPAIFIDTGLEYPEIRENGYPIISKEVGQIIEEARRNATTGKYTYRIKRLNGTALDKNGNKSIYNCPQWKFLLDAPFKISSRCCDIMKKTPSKRFAKETGMYSIVGTMTIESRLRKQQWLRHGCNIIDSKEPKSKPISFWTEQDILEYIVRYNLPYASVYGDIVQDNKGKYHMTGCQRTGCCFCMFGVHLEKEPNRFQMLKETHPKIYEYCMKPLENGGLGIKEIINWINEYGNLKNEIKY